MVSKFKKNLTQYGRTAAQLLSHFQWLLTSTVVSGGWVFPRDVFESVHGPEMT